MYKCRKCGCNCDNADIRNGLCDDCRGVLKRQTDALRVSASQAKKKYILKHNKTKSHINTSRKARG